MQFNQPSKPRSKKREWADKLSTIFLVIASIISFIIALASLFDPINKYIITILPSLGAINLTALLLLLFSILGIAIGLERYATFDEVRDETHQRHSEVIQAINQIQQITEQHGLNLGREIAEIQQTLITTIETKVLFGPDAVYAEAIRLIRACDGSEIIRATSLDQFTALEGITELENIKIYRTYLEMLAKTVGQKKHNTVGMVYKIVLGVRPNEKGELPLSFKQSVQNRKELFKNNDALDKLQIKWVNGFWSLDLMIVGNKQIIIMFPTNIGDRYHRLAIRITHDNFVRDVTRWYDERLWQEATELI